LNHTEHYLVFNLTLEEPVIDMKDPAGECKAEPVPGIHQGEGFSSNALDISKAKGYNPSFHVSFVLAIRLYEVKNSKH